MVFTIYDVMEAGMNKTMTTDVNKTKLWSIKQIFYNDHPYDKSIDSVTPSSLQHGVPQCLPQAQRFPDCRGGAGPGRHLGLGVVRPAQSLHQPDGEGPWSPPSSSMWRAR